MKNKSFFSQILLLIILSIVCLVLTVTIAFIAGSQSTTFIDFKNLNIANMLPVLICGGFISCLIVGITVLFITRSVFYKVKDYFAENDKEDK